jgi:hypothetical protein
LKVVLVKEKGTVRLLEGDEHVSSIALELKSRLTSGNIQFYELDFDENLGIELEAYITAINMYPEFLKTSKMIKKIS